MKKLTKKKYDKNICVVGLGYVGLTLAVVMAEKGFNVVGIEKRQKIVDFINKGQPYFFEPDLKKSLLKVVKNNKLKAINYFDKKYKIDVYIITVGTPLYKNNKSRIDFIIKATKQVAKHFEDGALISIRSTVKIGTTRKIVKQILKKTGKKFDLAMCPERTLEGNALKELIINPQIIGADSVGERERAAALFKRITSKTILVSSLETAEIIKLVDNTFRDVQFGFSNEVARVCENYGVNVLEVISSGKKNFKRTDLPIPGLVGGPCLGKDPHIFVESAKSTGISMEITQAARIVNERQPKETLKFILHELKKRFSGRNLKISLLGIAFKGLPITDDLRGSMALKLIKYLEKYYPQSSITLFDPVLSVNNLKNKISGKFIFANSLFDAIKNSHVVIIANNHPLLSSQKPFEILKLIKKNGFIYDYWNNFNYYNSKKLSNFYYSVGNINTNNE